MFQILKLLHHAVSGAQRGSRPIRYKHGALGYLGALEAKVQTFLHEIVSL